jgi:hypothetical protein
MAATERYFIIGRQGKLIHKKTPQKYFSWCPTPDRTNTATGRSVQKVILKQGGKPPQKPNDYVTLRLDFFHYCIDCCCVRIRWYCRRSRSDSQSHFLHLPGTVSRIPDHELCQESLISPDFNQKRLTARNLLSAFFILEYNRISPQTRSFCENRHRMAYWRKLRSGKKPSAFPAQKCCLAHL